MALYGDPATRGSLQQSSDRGLEFLRRYGVCVTPLRGFDQRLMIKIV